MSRRRKNADRTKVTYTKRWLAEATHALSGVYIQSLTEAIAEADPALYRKLMFAEETAKLPLRRDDFDQTKLCIFLAHAILATAVLVRQRSNIFSRAEMTKIDVAL